MICPRRAAVETTAGRIRKWKMENGGLEHLFFFPVYWECHHPN